MKHYSCEEWKAFLLNEGSFDEAEMENHLLECDICSELFLQNIDENLLQELEASIPPEFTGRAMRYIERNLPGSRKTKTIGNRLLASYAVAASLTLMLMGGGVFENLSGEMSRISRFQDSAVSFKVSTFLNKWTAQVKFNTWDWFEKIPLREDRR